MRQKTILCLLIVSLLLISLNLPVYASSLRLMKFGAEGGQVIELQNRLKKLGYYYGPTDGVYGKLMERAVIRFQTDYRLRIDGIAGRSTINKLYSLQSVERWVQPGDSWFKLSQRYQVPTWKIKSHNNIYNNHLYVGQRLEIPVADSEPKVTTAVNYSANRQLGTEEFNLLARAVYSEARGEPYVGQVAVAAVILNRVEDDRFPNTIKGVVFEPWAFTAVHDGQFWLQPDQTAQQAVRAALKDWDPTRGAVFYYNPAKVTSHWIYSRKPIRRIGKHVFAV